MGKAKKRMAALISLHFAPVYASHLIAYGKLLRSDGWDVCFIVHPKYAGFADFEDVGTVIEKSETAAWLKTSHANVALFLNAAIGNALLATRMKREGVRAWYVFHEPDALRNHFSESLKDLATLAVAQMASITMLLVSSGVIVPSQAALARYQRHFLRYNGNVSVVHLLFDDELPADCRIDSLESRRHFSFIGNASEAHGFRAFLEFAKHALGNGCDFDFSIATRSTISASILNDPEMQRYIELGRMHIQQGRVLSAVEMTASYLESFCVWNLYRCTTQSGVLPRAFMLGTPVIANSRGSFPEFVRPGMNGELIDNSDDWDSILYAALRIRERFPWYARECRRAFCESFHYRAAKGTLLPLLQDSAQRAERSSHLVCRLKHPRPTGAARLGKWVQRGFDVLEDE
jgi:hypothetical protein